MMYRLWISPTAVYPCHMLDAPPSAQLNLCRPRNKTEKREWSLEIYCIPTTLNCEKGDWGEVRQLRALHGFY